MFKILILTGFSQLAIATYGGLSVLESSIECTETVLKTGSYERILILHDTGTLELELNGKPISRNGVLKENGISRRPFSISETT